MYSFVIGNDVIEEKVPSVSFSDTKAPLNTSISVELAVQKAKEAEKERENADYVNFSLVQNSPRTEAAKRKKSTIYISFSLYMYLFSFRCFV